MSDLNDVLEGNTEEIAETSTEEPVIEAAPTVEEGLPTEPETEVEKPSEELIPKSALLDERHKRQELQQQLADLQAQIPQEKPDYWNDPEKAFEQLESKIGNALQTQRLNTSEQLARSRHDDLDEKLDAFQDMVKENPSLQMQMLNAPDPAEFAYNAAKTHLEISAAGSVEDYRAQIEADVKQKLEAEYAEKFGEALKGKIPPTLSTARGAGNSSPEWSGPASLDKIVG